MDRDPRLCRPRRKTNHQLTCPVEHRLSAHRNFSSPCLWLKIFLHVLQSVAKQLLNNTKIDLDGKISRVIRTSSQHLRTTTFEMDGRQFQAIEQNATKPSRWGQLAREGHQVIQFKDVQTNRFVAVSVDGEITEYKQS